MEANPWPMFSIYNVETYNHPVRRHWEWTLQWMRTHLMSRGRKMLKCVIEPNSKITTWCIVVCFWGGVGKGGFLVLKHYRTEDSGWDYGFQRAKNCLAALFFFSTLTMPRGHFLRNSMSPCISWLSCRTTYEKNTAHHHSLCTAKTSVFQQLFVCFKARLLF